MEKIRSHGNPEPKDALRVPIFENNASNNHRRHRHERHAIHQGTTFHRLMHGIAHNYDNLLMTVLAHVSQIERDMSLGQPPAPLIRKLTNKIEQGAALNKKIAAFGGIENYNLKPTDPHELIENCMAETVGPTPAIITMNCRFHCSNAAYCDPKHIRCVFNAIFTNAIEAMPNGGTLSVFTRNTLLDHEGHRTVDPEGDPFVHVVVSDTGIGMEEKISGLVFEPFFSTKGVDMGKGMSLASAWGIVQDHGGFMEISSSPGNGSTFEVYLPEKTCRRIWHSHKIFNQPLKKQRSWWWMMMK